MSVTLERFAQVSPKALVQSESLRDSVNFQRRYQRNWMANERPELCARYRDFAHAAYNVIRLAWTDRKNYDPFVIWDNDTKIMAGTATLIRRQRVMHPDPKVGVVEGTDVDYWLHEGTSPEMHQEVTAKLLWISGQRAVKDELRARGMRDDVDNRNEVRASIRDRVIAVVDPNATHQPNGLMDALEAKGDPDILMPVRGYLDPYNYNVPKYDANNPQAKQLYYAALPIAWPSLQ